VIDGLRYMTLVWSLAAAVASTAAPPDQGNAPEEEEPEFTREGFVEAPEGLDEEEESDKSLQLDFRFAVRVNLFHKSWLSGSDRNGAQFDTIMLGLDASRGQLYTSIQYRFYDGYNMLHHGFIGYQFNENTAIEAGVHRKPFGLLPFASHNYFFNLPYYMGFEDDYDLGVKVHFDRQPYDLRLGYYFRDEGNYYGESLDSARYSYDIVKTDASELGSAGVTTPRTNQERNQLNGRLAYTFDHGTVGSTEIGCSGEVGQILNDTTGGNGTRWAAAVHLNGNYDRFNLQLEAARFANYPDNPPGQDDSFIVRGAYDAPYKTASNGWLFIANLAYRIPIDKKPFDAITLYTDYSYLLKLESAFSDSQQVVVGASIEAGPALVYIDLAFGRNHPWLGPDYSTALAEGDPNADWEFRFNINIGFYF
jgi:hypothetical protein